MSENQDQDFFVVSDFISSEGNLYRSPENPDQFLKLASNVQGMNPSGLTLLTKILKLASTSGKDSLVSFKDIYDTVKNEAIANNQVIPSPNAIKKRLARLAYLGIFTTKKVSYLRGSAGRNRIFLPSANILNLPTETPEERKQAQSERGKIARASRELVPQVLKSTGLRPEPPLDNHDFEQVVLPKKTFEIFEQLVCPFPTNHYVTTVELNGRTAFAEASSAVQVMRPEDLRALYAMFNLTLRYHAYHLPYYIKSQILPTNKTPMHLPRALKLLGVADGGSGRKTVRNMFERIRTTTWDLHQLDSVFNDDESKELFWSKEFRFFESFDSSSDTKPELGADGKVKKNPNFYIISWNSSIFNKLLEDKFFFVIPEGALKAADVIFMLYLHFRKRLRDKDVSFTGDELYSRIGKSFSSEDAESDNRGNWHRSMIHHLKAFRDSPERQYAHRLLDDEREVIMVDLWGYEVHATLSKSRIELVEVHVDQEEVVRQAKASININRRNAPQILNPLNKELSGLIDYHNNQLKMVKSDDISKPILSELRKLGVKITQRKYATKLSYEDFNLTINAYHTDEQLMQSSKVLMSFVGDGFPAYDALKALRGKASFIEDRDNHLDVQGMADFISVYSDMTDSTLTQSQVIEVLSSPYKSKLRKAIIEGQYSASVNELRSSLRNLNA